MVTCSYLTIPTVAQMTVSKPYFDPSKLVAPKRTFCSDRLLSISSMQCGSHQLHVATVHLKCGHCD